METTSGFEREFSPAVIYDALTGALGTGIREAVLNLFDVVEVDEGASRALREGDLWIYRPPAEGGLGQVRVVTGELTEAVAAECGAHGHLVVRPRSSSATPSGFGADLETLEPEVGLPEDDEEAWIEEDLPTEAEKAPLGVPTSDPVPFADPPHGAGHWPVDTSNPRAREINYRAEDGSNVGGNPGRQFLANRSGGQRHHAGVDLFASVGDPVIACEDGRIVNFYGFCCGQRKTTNALIVDHGHVVVNYGEVAPDSLSRLGLAKGSEVQAGQVIGSVGRNPGGSSMIHFETYAPGTRANLQWRKGDPRPPALRNPTRYLLALRDSGSVPSSAGGGTSVPSPRPSVPAAPPVVPSPPPDRRSREYIRWVQTALNQISGAGLVVDGHLGDKTRAAIRAFQERNNLTVDGVVGPQTEAALLSALRAAGAAGGPTSVLETCRNLAVPQVLDEFEFGKDEVRPHHEPKITTIAQCVIARQGTDRPIVGLRAVGHTDPVGTQADNQELGRRRAERVMDRIVTRIADLKPVDHPTIFAQIESRGELEPASGGPEKSRRVEIFPVRQATPTPVTPTVPLPPTPPPPVTPPVPRLPSVVPVVSVRPSPSRWMRIMAGPDLHVGNFANFLVDGAATFRAMLAAIRTADTEEHFIYLLGWWLSDDFPLDPRVPGSRIRDLFAGASSRGVQIRAMLWDQVGSQNSAETQRINRLANGAAILDDHTFGQRLLGISVGSHHQKVLVVKGREGLIGFCGGIDINPDRVASASGSGSSGGAGPPAGPGPAPVVVASSGGSSGRGQPLHEVHCRIEGPTAHDLLQTFIRRWDAHPEHRRIDRSRGDLRGRREPRPTAVPPRSATGNGASCAARIARTYNPVTPPPPGTVAVRERSIRETLILAIQNARRFIYMEEQYLVNLEAAALLNAALSRLAHVTILVPGSEITDMPRRWEARLRFVNRFTRGPHGHKARVFLLSSPPNTPGTRPRFGGHTYVHAKTWIIDDELAVIGSANCNRRGWTHDSEVNAILFEERDPGGSTFAQRLRMKLWAEHLNVPPGSVADGVASASLWVGPPPGARIRAYNPRADTDPFADQLLSMDIIDPSGPP